ncbi:transporter substrate-binding domain-containing protein [Psychrobacillus sp. L4]|uniref:transporter substrate-binding domain-containing protein n=1 Tax=Psychrobacillus sp. L4 TaxID=3236892 RepID=UPI0036F3528F
MKKFLSITLMLVLSMILLAACGSSDSKESGSTDSTETIPTKKLMMGTSADYPPYEDYDTNSGEIVGFDIDLAKYIGKKLGFEIEVKDIDFNGLIPAIQSKRVDFVMSGMTPTPEREENVSFSNIYYEAIHTIVAKEGTNYETLEDLKGKKVGVQLGSIQEGRLKDAEGIEIVPLNKIPEIIQELKSNRIDAAVIEDTVAKGYTESNSDLKLVVIQNNGNTGSAVAFPKDSSYPEEFNKVIDEMKQDGEMEKLIKKWFEKK